MDCCFIGNTGSEIDRYSDEDDQNKGNTEMDAFMSRWCGKNNKHLVLGLCFMGPFLNRRAWLA